MTEHQADDAELRVIANRKRGMDSFASDEVITGRTRDPEDIAVDAELRRQLAVKRGLVDG